MTCNKQCNGCTKTKEEEMKKESRLKLTLIAISDPWCWSRLYQIDKDFDDFLWNALQTMEIEVRSKYHIKIGERFVWTANYPFASGSPMIGELSIDESLCKRSTALLLKRKLKEAKLRMGLKK